MLSEVLNRVAVAETIQIEQPAVSMISRSASGSFRDALGTLDQLVAYSGKTIELNDVLELLGAADADLLFGVVDAIVASDPKAVLVSGRDDGPERPRPGAIRPGHARPPAGPAGHADHG